MKPILNFLKYLIPFGLICFAIQYFVTVSIFKNQVFFYNLYSVYFFQFVASLLSYLFVIFVHNNFPDKTGFAFMGVGLLKMMAAIVFLLPLIQSDILDKIPDVAAFFIPYFLFLLLETFFVVRLLGLKK